MRVTSNTFSNGLLSQLNNLSAQQSRLQAQAASGQRITRPEDDPVAVGRVLDFQAEAGAVAQYQKNIGVQQQITQASLSAMQSLKKIVDRAGEIVTLADGLKAPDQLGAYASEVTQLIRQAVQLTNAKNNNSYLFGGTLNNQPPFVLTEGANGTVAGVAYQGNTTVTSAEIAEGQTLAVHTVGANSSGSGPAGLISDPRSGADLFAHLISLQNHLRAGDSDAINATDRTQLAGDEENLINHIATNGGIQARLETASSLASDRAFSLQKSVSGEVDVDLAETLVKLSQTQTAYQAALQTGAKVLNLSLLDYLR